MTVARAFLSCKPEQSLQRLHDLDLDVLLDAVNDLPLDVLLDGVREGYYRV
jgi:hypothetical protein